MSGRHPFINGRLVLLIPVLLATHSTVAFIFWYAAIDIGPSGLPVPELSGGACAIAVALCLRPRMASWEATAVPRVRRLAAGVALLAYLATALIPFLVQAAVTQLPSSVVPHADTFDVDDYTRAGLAPVVTNLFIIGGVTFVAVALLGRLTGAVASIISWGFLFWAAARTDLSLPYWALHAGSDDRESSPFAAFIAVVTVALTWLRTGGTSLRARQLDG